MNRNKLSLALAALLLTPAIGAVHAQNTSSSDTDAQSRNGSSAQNAKQMQTITVTVRRCRASTWRPPRR